MAEIDLFGVYVRDRLDEWGAEFALHRDFEYLGHQSKNMLQVLIDHKGEIPPPNTGYKPLEVSMTAMQVEDVVAAIARREPSTACVLRAYYCGRGRRKVERWETANLLIAYTGGRTIGQRHYMTLVDSGFHQVRSAFVEIAQAA